MRFARLVVLPAILAAPFLFASASKAPAEDTENIRARFEIFGLAGLHVLTNRTTIEKAADRYLITMDLDTRGLARVFVDLTSHSEVHGRLARDAARPDAYRAEVLRNGVDRSYGVDYRTDGTVINAPTLSSPGWASTMPAAQLRGTVDQLTAYFLLERQLAQRRTCTLVVPVFDGSALYNVRFTDIKSEVLAADGYQNFAGPTQLCQVVREEILRNPGQGEDTYQQGKVWYAPLASGDLMLPVRMEFETAFGTVRGYLAELGGHGVHLHLMRE
jgi:Protein of unknown function (DUF3108)